MKLQSDYSQETWFKFLTKEQQILVEVSYQLFNDSINHQQLSDYSYIVFPMAKAYEGFLKKMLFEQRLIPEPVYLGKKFRIGRSLNPDVRSDQQDQYWLYDDLVNIFGEGLSRQIWETWLKCRNQVFHYFVKEPKMLTIDQAGQDLEMMRSTMGQTINLITNY